MIYLNARALTQAQSFNPQHLKKKKKEEEDNTPRRFLGGEYSSQV